MKNYTLILGESPSKGARSPLLWNKTYSELKIDQKMYPRDIALKNLTDKITETHINFKSKTSHIKMSEIELI